MKKQQILFFSSMSIVVLALVVGLWQNFFLANNQNNPEGTVGQAQNQNSIIPKALAQEKNDTSNAIALANTIPPSSSGATINEVSLAAKEKYIALTFDDGPSSNYTPQVLNILHKNNIKGTFFVIGQNLKEHPELAKRIVAEGNVIGNHTWHHWYRKMDKKTAAAEIDNTANLIYQSTGVLPTLFRPPGGIMNNGLVGDAKKNHYAVVIWSDDSLDYRRSPAPTLVRRVLKQAKPGGIILMHDGGGNRSHTVQALPQIISKLKQQGYHFVTVPELLKLDASKRTVKQLPTPT